MSQPREFQRRTIERALKAFDRKRRVRRFLVADEVGLGKTVVARGVIEAMLRRRRRADGSPLRVFYMCNSLAIAAQNRNNLQKAQPDGAEAEDAVCKVDRLTLIATHELPDEYPLHLYTLTPDTSMPDRKGRNRAGTARERALIHNIMRRECPAAVKHNGEEWLQQRARSSWNGRNGWKASPDCQPSTDVARRFVAELYKELELDSGQPLLRSLRKRLDRKGQLDVIKLLRVVLARTGLQLIQPDLVILDEFQRFRDLLDCDETSQIAKWMLRVEGPAVLLLSATPYRMYGGEVDDLFANGSEHHRDFFKLIEWLFGGGRGGEKAKQELETLFEAYGRSLMSAEPFGDRTLRDKKAIEERLRPVMARTERLLARSQKAVQISAPVDRDDLQVFQDLVRCFRAGAGGEKRSAGAAVAYWSSVPLPLQMLGPDYKAWKGWSDSNLKTKPRRSLLLTKERRDRFAAPKRWPNHKLRAMAEQYSASTMSIPWIQPSMPWWPLAKTWNEPRPTKALIFSRFRAVPRAIAGLLSYDVERRRLYGGRHDYGRASSRTLIGLQRENLAFFHTSATLSRLVDPWQLELTDSKTLVGAAARELKINLKKMDIAVVRDKGRRARRVPDLLVRLERTAGSWGRSREAWLEIATLSPRRTVGEDGVLAKAVLDWDSAVKGTLETVSESEVRSLAELAVGSPGAVIARSLERHCSDYLNDDNAVVNALRASWEGFRGYFNNTWMDIARGMRGPKKRSYRERIRWAVIHGNLESVLDEHLWVTRVLRHIDPCDLADELTKSVSLRTSYVRIQNRPDARFNLRTHAAFAFAPGPSRPGPGEGGVSQVRTEDIRISFNSPFWPFIVASTSVGQEGLDFHSWCKTVVHWDLPGNAVDLEQREGRIDRYAGLSTRLVAANKYRPHRDEVLKGQSPWEALAARADSESHDNGDSGLSPWWVLDGAGVDRIVFDVPISESRTHFERLKTQRLLYRLALGQPNQADFVRALEKRVENGAQTELKPEQVAKATIDLGEVG